MPLYEYSCGQCYEVTEAIQKFSDEPLKTCEKCGGELTKLMSSTSFALRGQGWYTTDYKKKSDSSKSSSS